MAARHLTTMAHLRESRLAGFLAMLLLVFQVVLSADHLGAAAASSFGPRDDGTAVGLLSLCHGDGSILYTDGDADRSAPPQTPPCILCVTATLAAHAVAVAPPALPAPEPTVFVDLTVVVADEIRAPAIQRNGSARGPPLPFVV